MGFTEAAVISFDFVQRLVDREEYRYRHSGAFNRYFTKEGEPKYALLELTDVVSDAAYKILGREASGFEVVGSCAHWMFGRPNDRSDLDILVATDSVVPNEDGPEAVALMVRANPGLSAADIASFKRTGRPPLQGPGFVDIHIAPGYPPLAGRCFDLQSRTWRESYIHNLLGYRFRNVSFQMA